MDLRELIETDGPHDVNWLQQMLQQAIQLEFFTLPPYLIAMWSIVDQGHEAVRVLRSIAYEEMEHMALACNMLLAAGGVPKINDPKVVPTYPNSMPGKVNPNFKIGLRRFSRQSNADFMKIEAPEVPLHFRTAEAAAETFSRIGELYDAIENAFIDLEKTLPWKVELQIAGPLAQMVVANLHEARTAIERIRSQGEGSELQATGVDGRIAHYYRFQQFDELKRLSPNPAAPNGFEWKETIQFPDALPMADIPCGGYSYQSATPDAAIQLRAFDRAYTLMLDHLQSAWGERGQAGLYDAIVQMFELQAPARKLMQIQIPGSSETYGPQFRYDPSLIERG